MHAFHITHDPHRFSLSHNEPVLDALGTLEREGYVQHVVDDGDSWRTKVRGVTFAMLESGLDTAIRSYPALENRWGLAVLDLSDCHDDDFIQGRWLPDELIIVDPIRTRVAARVVLPPCSVGLCSSPGLFGDGMCGWHTLDGRHVVDWRNL